MNGYASGTALSFTAGCDCNFVEGCFVGTDVLGATAVANSAGITIAGSSNTIGGLTPAARNLISGNSGSGVTISTTAALSNVVEGNFIGLNAAGTGDLGNGTNGILLSDAPATTIGGATAAARNFISGNNSIGIKIATTASHGYVIEGNTIGTDVTGTVAVGNAAAGLALNNAQDVTIRGNLISGNGASGIDITGAVSTNYTITGNIIGLNASGTAALPNLGIGMAFSSAHIIQIGGLTAAERNVISGNGSAGIFMLNCNAITIEGNYVGTAATGAIDRGNAGDGLLAQTCDTILVGGTAAGAGNIFSGNDGRGAAIIGFSTNFTVQGNYIGTDSTGLVELFNNGTGLDILGTNGLIGGTTAAARNIISGNGGDALFVRGTNAFVRVLGNYIGVDATGTGPLYNGGTGVVLDSVTNVIVGGTGAGEGNVIAYNLSGGVTLTNLFGGPTTAFCSIRGNSMHDNGTDPSTGLPSIFFSPITGLPASTIGIDIIDIAGLIGTTPNDPLDADSGANDLQNFPLLLSAASNSAGTTVTGFINTSAGAPLFLDFYANDTTGPFGVGEGKQYLGTIALGTDGFGNANFTAQLPTIAAGKFITATATNIGNAPYGNTSEFAQNVVVTAAPNPVTGGAGNGSGPSFALAGFDTGVKPTSIAVGDLNGDGFDDIVTANSKAGTVSVLLANGAGGFADAVTYGTGGKKPTGVVLGDFDGDGHRDLAVTNAGSANIAILLGLPNGTFAAATTFAAGKNPTALIAAKFDGDTFLDLACIIGGNKVCVLPGSGTGSFDAGAKFAVGKTPVALASGDFNDDGRADLVTASSLGNNVSVLRGNAAGSFDAMQNFRTGTKPVGLAVGDFNGDGFDDLAVANGVSRFVGVLLSHGAAAGAQFASQIKIPYPGLKGVRAIVAGDVDGDGRTDLIVANGLAGSFSLLLGRGNGLFRGPFETELTGEPKAMPASMALGDFDGDGRLDFAVAEIGASDVIVAFRQT
jgi:hypothetical protein